MSKQPLHAMRLALRVEGDWWKAYAAEAETMNGALLLGTIRMALVGDDPETKNAFMALMKAAFERVLRDDLGVSIDHWDEPQPAPEQERAGRA